MPREEGTGIPVLFVLTNGKKPFSPKITLLVNKQNTGGKKE